LLQALKYEFDKHVYYYGQHFRHPYESSKDHGLIVKKFQENVVRFSQVAAFLKSHPDWASPPVLSDPRPAIVCGAYYDWRGALEKSGWQTHVPLWMPAQPGNQVENLIRILCALLNELFPLHYQILLNKEFHSALREITQILRQYYSHPAFRAIMVAYTNPFFECTATRLFRDLGKTTYLAVHGLLGNYSWWRNGEHPTIDYYVVWGEKTKRHLVEAGMRPDQVLVSGHPDYQGCKTEVLRFGLENILVLGRSVSGAPGFNNPIYQNRGDSLEYLYRLQIALRKVGIRRVRLRPHPAESPAWYQEFVDSSFFDLNTDPLPKALEASSLVIGPMSTVFIESLGHGVNYVVFEPNDEYYNPGGVFYHLRVDSPFDGSDPRVPVAKNEEQLLVILKNRKAVDISCIPDYIQPTFSPDVIRERRH